MTEYELADLALSNQALFWEQSQTLVSAMELLNSSIDRIAALLFGFLTVVYFVGNRLTRAQAWVLSFLYLVWQARLLFIVGIISDRAVGINQAMAENGSAVVRKISWASQALPTIILLLVCILASVYFMWSVRRQPRV